MSAILIFMARDLLRDERNLGSHISPRGKVLRGIEPDPKNETPNRGLISAKRPHVSMLGLNREGARHTFHQICMESTSGGLAEMRPSEGLKLGSIGKKPYFRGSQINTSLQWRRNELIF